MNVAELSTAVEKVDTWNPKREGSGYFTYVDLSSIDRQLKAVTVPSTINASDAPSRARQLIKAGDVLVSTVRPNLNAVAFVPPGLSGATASTGFCVLRPRSERLDGRYLFHWVCSPRFIGEMVSLATGASYPAVSDKIVKGSSIPLPPIEEQRRIAAVLDAADALRSKRRQALAKLNILTQAIFTEMFADTAGLVAIDAIAERIVDYRGKSPTKTKSGVPLITARVVKNFELLEPNEFIADEDYESWMRRGIPQPGDVIFTTEAPLGQVAQISDSRVALAQRLVLIRPSPSRMTGEFLMYALRSQGVMQEIAQRATGSTVIGIRQKELRKVRLPVPPLSDQRTFAERVRAISAARSRALQSRAHLECCFAVLQQLAFRGEL